MLDSMQYVWDMFQCSWAENRKAFILESDLWFNQAVLLHCKKKFVIPDEENQGGWLRLGEEFAIHYLRTKEVITIKITGDGNEKCKER